MKLNFPRVTRKIDVSQYAPGFTGEITVWVNPPASTIDELSEALKGMKENPEPVYNMLALIYSQGEQDTHMSAEDVKESFEESANTDPMFFPWLINQTFEIYREHRTTVKKA